MEQYNIYASREGLVDTSVAIARSHNKLKRDKNSLENDSNSLSSQLKVPRQCADPALPADSPAMSVLPRLLRTNGNGSHYASLDADSSSSSCCSASMLSAPSVSSSTPNPNGTVTSTASSSSFISFLSPGHLVGPVAAMAAAAALNASTTTTTTTATATTTTTTTLTTVSTEPSTDAAAPDATATTSSSGLVTLATASSLLEKEWLARGGQEEQQQQQQTVLDVQSLAAFIQQQQQQRQEAACTYAQASPQPTTASAAAAAAASGGNETFLLQAAEHQQAGAVEPTAPAFISLQPAPGSILSSTDLQQLMASGEFMSSAARTLLGQSPDGSARQLYLLVPSDCPVIMSQNAAPPAQPATTVQSPHLGPPPEPPILEAISPGAVNEAPSTTSTATTAATSTNTVDLSSLIAGLEARQPQTVQRVTRQWQHHQHHQQQQPMSVYAGSVKTDPDMYQPNGHSHVPPQPAAGVEEAGARFRVPPLSTSYNPQPVSSSVGAHQQPLSALSAAAAAAAMFHSVPTAPVSSAPQPQPQPQQHFEEAVRRRSEPHASAATATPTTFLEHLNPESKDLRRRVSHNEVERRRRDRINNWISELYKLLPPDEQAKSQYQSKGIVLKRVCEYFQNVDSMLKSANAAVEQTRAENRRLHQRIRDLEQEFQLFSAVAAAAHLKQRQPQRTDLVNGEDPGVFVTTANPSDYAQQAPTGPTGNANRLPSLDLVANHSELRRATTDCE